VQADVHRRSVKIAPNTDSDRILIVSALPVRSSGGGFELTSTSCSCP